MRCDEYGQPRPGVWKIVVNITRCRELWDTLTDKLRRRKDMDRRLVQARREAEEWDRLVNREPLTRQELVELLKQELANRKESDNGRTNT